MVSDLSAETDVKGFAAWGLDLESAEEQNLGVGIYSTPVSLTIITDTDGGALTDLGVWGSNCNPIAGSTGLVKADTLIACRPVINIGTFSWDVSNRIPDDSAPAGVTAEIDIYLDQTTALGFTIPMATLVTEGFGAGNCGFDSSFV